MSSATPDATPDATPAPDRSVAVRVTGRVQGVSFRAGAAQEAVRVGVAGWVRNEPDGAVTAHVEGHPDGVEAMLGWLRTGSPAARVDAVEVRETDPDGATSFEVRS